LVLWLSHGADCWGWSSCHAWGGPGVATGAGAAAEPAGGAGSAAVPVT